jgi:hypothetical protein
MTEKHEIMWKMKEYQDKSVYLDIHNWLNNELFTWNWLILILFLIVPWIIWIKVFERKRVIEILLFGALVFIPTTYLDSVGEDLSFWIYPTELFPWDLRAFGFDISMVSVTYMLIYQYFGSWKSYIIAQISMSFIFSFIGEPLSHYLDLVLYIKWTYFYSFLYYIILGISVKTTVEKIKRYTPKC